MAEVKEFRRKPPVVKAIQWTGQPEQEINEAINDWVDIYLDVQISDGDKKLFILGKGGYSFSVRMFDYIVIKGKKVKGYTEREFEAKYEAL